MNMLSCRRPSHILLSDSCLDDVDAGMGGYSVTSGNAWRLKLDAKVLQEAGVSNNVLEFLACIITQREELLLIEKKRQLYHNDDANMPLSLRFPCFLGITDSSSSVGWLYRFRSPTKQPWVGRIARDYARHMLAAQAIPHPQHIPGIQNEVSDLLSRSFTKFPALDDRALTQYICSKFTSQIPASFHIRPLSRETSSWLIPQSCPLALY